MATDLLAGRDLLAETQGRDLLGGRDLLALTEQPKKPIFRSQTPEQEVFGQVASRAVNTLGFGLPGFVAGKAGYEIPEPTTPAGRIGAGVGDLLGFIGGPAKVGGKVAAKGLAKFTARTALNPTTAKLIGNRLAQGAIGLGVASGLMTPEEGLFAPKERLKQFGSGAVTGLAFGGMSYIPNKAARILANASYIGIPSTLREEPLEQQVFNYGLGAYFGIHGTTIKTQREQMKKLETFVRDGMKKQAGKALGEMDKLLNEMHQENTNKDKKVFEIPKKTFGKPKGLITLIDRYFRPGYSLLEKLGGGKFVEDGITNTLHLDDVSREVFRERYYTASNTWKRAMGMSKATATDTFRYLEGKISKKNFTSKYGDTGLRVAQQMRSFLDYSIDAVNIQKKRYGEKPIEKRKNYAAHIWDFYKEGSGQQVALDELAMYQEFLGAPSKQTFIHERKREGATGFTENVWQMLDIYAFRANKSANDNFVRQAKQHMKFLEKQQRLRKNKKQIVDFDVANQYENIKEFVKDFQNHPDKLDFHVHNTVKAFDRWAEQMGVPIKLNTVNRISNTLVGMLYSTQMGFRPKLAIRNLGQHMLTIGQTGFKPLVKALSVKRSPEVLNILSKSTVLKSRGTSFVPEAQGLQEFARQGMTMFRQADKKNVVDSFLAGYYQHLAKNPGDNAGAVKRGDYVAGLTQFIYLNGNRSGLARGVGGRSTRPLSVFTSWPINYVEFLVASAQPEHRANLLKYLATGAGFIGISALAGVKGINYTGMNSPKSLLSMATGNIPITGIIGRPRVQVFEDIKKLFKDDDGLKELLFYTLE